MKKEISKKTKEKINQDITDLFTSDSIEKVENIKDKIQIRFHYLIKDKYLIDDYVHFFFENIVPYVNAFKKGRMSYCGWRNIEGYGGKKK